MFVRYRTLGFFLKKEDRGEADQVFTVYTKDFGKLKVLAKSVRKTKSKLRPGAEIFYLSEIEFVQGRAYKILTDTLLADKFKNIRQDLTRLFWAKKVLSSLDNLLSGQEPDLRLWQLTTETLKALDSLRLKKDAGSSLYYYFIWNLLAVLGYGPQINGCSVCSTGFNKEKIFFAPSEGGAVCQKCSKSVRLKVEISLEIIKILKVILKRDRNLFLRLRLEKSHLELLSKITKHYLNYL